MLGGSLHLLSQLYDRVVPIYSRQGSPTLKSCSKMLPPLTNTMLPYFHHTGLVLVGSADLQCRRIYHHCCQWGYGRACRGKIQQQQWIHFTDYVLEGTLFCLFLKTWGDFRSGKKKNWRKRLIAQSTASVFHEGLYNVQVLHRESSHILSSIELSWVVHP